MGQTCCTESQRERSRAMETPLNSGQADGVPGRNAQVRSVRVCVCVCVVCVCVVCAMCGSGANYHSLVLTHSETISFP